MKKFLFIFVAIFLSVPVMARVCMSNNPTTIATQAQVADLQTQITTLSERIAIANPFPWIQTWSSASGKLANSSVQSVNDYLGTWLVTANQDGTGIQTASGSSLCSSINGIYAVRGSPPENVGRNCWCKMITPRAGVWVFLNQFYNTSSPDQECRYGCASACSGRIQDASTFRAAVLALP